jgi:hypothetical protein
VALATLGSAGEASCAKGVDHVTIGGRRLELAELVASRLFDADYIKDLRVQMCNARPFEHLVVEGWFHPVLLDLVREEFDRVDAPGWRNVRSAQENTLRSRVATRLGPASELYFGILGSGWFLDLMSELSGVEDLFGDPQKYNGGLHETRSGGYFAIHRDFDRHRRTGLRNEMVLITYLNRDWDPLWGGALELWDGDAKRCIKQIQPDFGRSVIMRHGPTSFHGHPSRLATPANRSRRSVAAYYYSDPTARQKRAEREPTEFLFSNTLNEATRVARRLLPPILWEALARVVQR